MHVREAEVAALVAEGEAFVVEAEEVQDGGVEVVGVDGVFGDVEAEVVGLAIDGAGPGAAALGSRRGGVRGSSAAATTEDAGARRGGDAAALRGPLPTLDAAGAVKAACRTAVPVPPTKGVATPETAAESDAYMLLRSTSAWYRLARSRFCRLSSRTVSSCWCM